MGAAIRPSEFRRQWATRIDGWSVGSGEGKGSWKGGTVGFSEEMLPGDSVADVVQRAAKKGRGR